MSAPADAMRLLREAIEALDADDELDRGARDRVVTAAIGRFHRELEAAQERRLRPRLFGERWS